MPSNSFPQERAGRSVRAERFLRLSQFVWLLNVECVSDVAEAWVDGSVAGGPWQLTGDEAKKTLALRDDFSRASIDSLTLA